VVAAAVRSIPVAVRSPVLLRSILAAAVGRHCSSLDFRGPSRTVVAVGNFGRRTFEAEGTGSLDCGWEEGIEVRRICRPLLIFVRGFGGYEEVEGTSYARW